MVGKFAELTTRLINYLIAAALSLMAIFVFGNVILRYFFNSGLTWAEEVSRFLFIWLIFLGAILALRDNEHLGVDTLVRKLSLKGKKILFIINNAIILITLLLVLDGSWKLTMLNIDQSSPAIGLPYAYVYVSGAVMSIGMIAIVIGKLYRVITNKLDENDLVMTTDSEEKADFKQDTRSITGGEK
jgi:TRAP-type C4-dicarboxylate transport system permease small subunit